MPAANHAPARPRHRRARQSGNAALEFGLVVTIFLLLIFGVLELARAMYIFNTLQEVTRRAASLAANTNFKDDAALQTVRQTAIFRTAAGTLALADPVSDQYIHIDYLSIARAGNTLTMTPIATGALPASPAHNRLNCTADLNAANCIRLVRVQVCMPGPGACVRVPFRTLFPMINLTVNLPTSTTIVQAETLGFTPGMVPLP